MPIKIGLDAGHGLKTSGKQTPDGIKEWTLNDKVRDKVVEFLKPYDVEIVHIDNDEGAVDESLASRLAKYINAGVAAFVSLHHNASSSNWSSATGVELYTDINPTSADIKLAKCIYNRLVKYTGLRGRGIKQEDFYVINQDKIPAVLCEGGFMDGSNDYKVITSDAGQTAYAKAVSEGLVEFLNIPKKQEFCWIKDNNGWYYIGSDGAMLTNEWVMDSVGWCYVGADGYAETNCWMADSIGWCYLDAEGRMVVNCWVKDSVGWCYLGDDGHAVENCWKQIDDRWYYFDGTMAVKGFKNIKGKLYYFAEKNEAMVKECQLVITNDNGEIKI